MNSCVKMNSDYIQKVLVIKSGGSEFGFLVWGMNVEF